VKALFGDHTAFSPVSNPSQTPTPMSTISPTATSPPKSGGASGNDPVHHNPSVDPDDDENKSVIAGAAVGTSAGVVAVGAVLIWAYMRRRRRLQLETPTKKPRIKLVELDSRQYAEFADQQRNELDQQNYWELSCEPHSPKIGRAIMESIRRPLVELPSPPVLAYQPWMREAALENMRRSNLESARRPNPTFEISTPGGTRTPTWI
jgi:hypothetical protein